MKILLKLSLFFASIYVLICTIVYSNQESLLFHPSSLPHSHVFSLPASFDEFSVLTTDKKQLNAVFLRAEKPKGTVLFFHGNAGNIEAFSNYYDFFLSQNFNCAVFDYRGFGKSEGTIENEKQFYNDARSFTDFIKQNYPTHNLLICGFSAGSAAAAKIALEEKTEKLVLLAPYYSMTELAHDKFPLIPGFLLKYRFGTWEFIENTNAQILLVHGKNDGVIPIGNSKKLQKAAGKNCRLVTENAGHNNLLMSGSAREKIADFIR